MYYVVKRLPEDPWTSTPGLDAWIKGLNPVVKEVGDRILFTDAGNLDRKWKKQRRLEQMGATPVGTGVVLAYRSGEENLSGFYLLTWSEAAQNFTHGTGGIISSAALENSRLWTVVAYGEQIVSTSQYLRGKTFVTLRNPTLEQAKFLQQRGDRTRVISLEGCGEGVTHLRLVFVPPGLGGGQGEEEEPPSPTPRQREEIESTRASPTRRIKFPAETWGKAFGNPKYNHQMNMRETTATEADKSMEDGIIPTAINAKEEWRALHDWIVGRKLIPPHLAEKYLSTPDPDPELTEELDFSVSHGKAKEILSATIPVKIEGFSDSLVYQLYSSDGKLVSECDLSGEHSTVHATESHKWDLDSPATKESIKNIINKTNLNRKEPVMALSIENNVTLINDRKAQSYSNEELMALIRSQESLRADFKRMETKSQYVEKELEKIQKNIDALVEVLDSRTSA